MKTYSFIGSDKNAGKTTAFNYLYLQLNRRYPGKHLICLTSIGINGEPVDSYENKEKPFIRILQNTLFITAGEHLQGLTGHYRIHATFSGTIFSKTYILARALDDFNIVLEGPNEKTAIEKIKETLLQIDNDIICLIDGSIDRQFLGHPSISDGICFALLVTNRPEQQKKAKDLLTALMLDQCDSDFRRIIDHHRDSKMKSLLCKTNGDIAYQSSEVPFLDEQLKLECLRLKNEQSLLYLRGSLSPTLYDFLAAFGKLSVVLDNYTCYQKITVSGKYEKSFRPKLSAYHSVPLKCLFLTREDNSIEIRIPKDIPVYNLFRDQPHEIRI